MEEKTVKTFSELLDEFSILGSSHIYRGVSNWKHKLIPSIGRRKYAVGQLEHIESDLIWLFKTQSIPYLQQIPTSDIEWLAIAQHHGLPTRLMDWTHNPLAAAYFAVEKDMFKDSAIYSYHPINVFAEETISDINDVDGVKAILPSHRANRIAAQQGLFTIHQNPGEPFEPKTLVKIVIPSRHKSEVRSGLNSFGINRASLFPDLDGLSDYLKWMKGFHTPDKN